jgi:HK97 family phage portal protein
MAGGKSLIGKMLNLAGPIPHASRWNVQGNRLYGSGGQDRFSQLQSMGNSGTLYAIVQLISTGQAKAVWKMFRSQQDGRVRYSRSDVGSDQRVEVLKHLAMDLWKKPNDFATGNDFREVGWQFMELVGEWYWVLDRGPSGKGVPIAMWNVRPDRMEPVPDRQKYLAGWIYSGPNGEQVPLDTSEVIQMRYPHPTDFYRGMSPIQSIMANIDSQRYTAEWSRNFFLNSATPGGIVTFSKRLTDDEFDEFSDRWREQHQGLARGHRVGVLEQGATWTQNTYTMRDMQFAELSKVDRDIIREAYRIHQAMLGNSDDVNRANAQTAEEVHVAWHEVTRLERTRNVLNSMYLPMFAGTSADREFDFEDPTPTSSNDANDELTSKSAAAAVLAKAGWDPGEVLEVVGLPPMAFTGPPAAALPGTPPGPGEGNPEASQYEFTRHEAVEAASALRGGVRRAITSRDMSDIEAHALASLIRESFGNSHTNGHKELV